MAKFPVLSRSPSIEGFVEELSREAVQVASRASGLPLLNKLFTFDPGMWKHTLNFISQIDKEAVIKFYEDNKDVPFSWLNKQDSVTYEVIFDGPPKCQIEGTKDHWRITLTLIQYSPL